MKINSLISVLIILFILAAGTLFGGNGSPADAKSRDRDQQDKPKYGFDTAYIEKTTTTSNEAVDIVTTEKIYVMNGGGKVAAYKHEKRNIKMLNKVEESRSVHIIDDKWLITYDPDTKEGTKMANTFTDQFSGMSQGQMEQFSKQMTDAMGTKTKEIGREEVAGKLCTVSEAVTNMAGMKQVTKTWMWKNYLMKSESEGMGSKISELVTKLEENVEVDKDKFDVPSYINITETKSPY
jgi:hypothetical protein